MRNRKPYPFTNLLHSGIAVRFSKVVLAEEDLDWQSILKTHDCVLPVPNVVSEAHVEDSVA